jgi:hypothetical protein
LALAVLVVGALSPVAIGGEGFVKTIPASKKTTLSALMRTATIKVVGWDRKEVKIECGSDLSRVIRVKGDEITIGPFPTHVPGAGSEDDIVVHVPSACPVKARNIGGDLTAEGTTGLLALTTVSGKIRVERVKGDLALKSVSGDIKGEAIGGSRLSVKAVSGDVRFRKVTSKTVSLKVQSGNISLHGAFPPEGAVRMYSVSGDSTIILPPDATFVLEARTAGGKVESEFKLEGEVSESVVNGKAGSGGTKISMSSAGGDLNIKKDK